MVETADETAFALRSFSDVFAIFSDLSSGSGDVLPADSADGNGIDDLANGLRR